MLFFQILALLGLIYGLLLWLVPKATNLHEILRLPLYQYRVQKVSTRHMQVRRHSFGAHRRQYLLHCRPFPDQALQRNVIIYYHGGGWAFGSPELFQANAQFFVHLGFEVFLPSYRHLPGSHYPEMSIDSSLALQKVMELLPNPQFEHRQIILSGMSAGGHLSALLFHDRQRLQALGLEPQQLFAGLLLFAAPLDLRAMRDSLILRSLAGKRDRPLFRAANPIEYLDRADSLPILCVHGNRDGLV
ncbi:MAG: alpha/beta hydrolase, partial [Bacteroidota bacterium]